MTESEKRRAELKQRIAARLKERVAARKARAAWSSRTPPIYDDVYWEGVAWLDSLAGEPIEPGLITIIGEDMTSYKCSCGGTMVACTATVDLHPYFGVSGFYTGPGYRCDGCGEAVIDAHGMDRVRSLFAITRGDGGVKGGDGAIPPSLPLSPASVVKLTGHHDDDPPQTPPRGFLQTPRPRVY